MDTDGLVTPPDEVDGTKEYVVAPSARSWFVAS
jgi:hypothetical protein